MRNKRLGNKGFSLLELLIGITMLAIIVVPILHAFLTSSKTSGKAKEVRNQTVAAQNIMESYEATDMGAIITGIKDGVAPFSNITSKDAQVFAYDTTSGYEAVTSITTDTADGPAYRILLPGVIGGEKTYDAVLNLSAAPYSARNSVGIVDYKPMDAVYIQPAHLDESNPDVIAAQYIASQAQIDSGAVVDYHYFLDKMARKVTVTLKKIEGDTDIITCTALFHYKAQYTYTLPDDSSPPPTDDGSSPSPPPTHTVDYTADISNDFYSGTYDAAENRSYGLYFFFYPNVPTVHYDGVPDDAIDVVNSSKITMSVYLIRQSEDGSSNPVIRLMEKAAGSNTPAAQMYYNNTIPYQYRYYLGYPNGDDGYSYFWFKSYPFDGNLIGTPAHNRLYSVTVDIYKQGSIQPDGSVTGTPLATFDASSLE